MARLLSQFVCQSCGASYAKWAGRCEACGVWNSLVEEAAPAGPRAKTDSRPAAARGRLEFVDLGGLSEPAPRRTTGIGELDRVTGGGLVAGSVLLVGGDPGIGKSTLLIQAMARLADLGAACAYVSGEEAVDQVRLRAHRLGIASSPVELAAATSVREICAALDSGGD